MIEMDIARLLQPGTILIANPERYDYVHNIKLETDGRVEMVDGGGQALRRQIEGRYEITIGNAAEAQIRFYDLLDVDPYKRSQETKVVKPFTTKVVLEKGPFAFECEVVWHVKPDEEPYVVFPGRIAFDDDPLAAGSEPWPEFPPDALEYPEIRNIVETHKRAVAVNRRYYAAHGRVDLTSREMRKLGLPAENVRTLT